MKRTHVTIAAALIALTLITGCDDDKNTSATTPAAARATPARTSTISAVGSVTGLERALLVAADDFPTGWNLTRVDGAKQREERSSLCNTVFTYTSLTTMQAEFSRNPTDPVVGHIVTQYTPGDARRALDDIQQVLRTCTEWQAPSADGKSYTRRIALLQMPNLGEQSAAFVVESGTPTGEAQSAIVLIRRGDVTSGLIFTEARRTSVDSPMIERLARRADQKLTAALR